MINQHSLCEPMISMHHRRRLYLDLFPPFGIYNNIFTYSAGDFAEVFLLRELPVAIIVFGLWYSTEQNEV